MANRSKRSWPNFRIAASQKWSVCSIIQKRYFNMSCAWKYPQCSALVQYTWCASTPFVINPFQPFLFCHSRNAMGIVKCLMSWEDMQKSHMRGKGFKVLHLCGDKLWYCTQLHKHQLGCQAKANQRRRPALGWIGALCSVGRALLPTEVLGQQELKGTTQWAGA